MADYLIQESTLDAIADAINAKTGGSSAMTPAQMVTAIGTISGGLPSGVTAITTGTVNFTSVTANVTITHNLGVTPKAFVFYLDDKWYNSLNNSVQYAQFIIVADGQIHDSRLQTTASSTSVSGGSSTMGTVNGTIVNFRRSQQAQGAAVPNQIIDSEGTTKIATYRWFAIA